MAAKTPSFLYFGLTILQKLPIFDLQMQNGYRQHTNKSDFYACEL